jgi:hypothetical protein
MVWKRSAERANSSQIMDGTGLLFVASRASFLVLRAILSHWGTYDWYKKFEALCLPTVLVVGPVRFIHSERKALGRIGRAEIVMRGYLCLMPASSLWGR